MLPLYKPCFRNAGHICVRYTYDIFWTVYRNIGISRNASCMYRTQVCPAHTDLGVALAVAFVQIQIASIMLIRAVIVP